MTNNVMLYEDRLSIMIPSEFTLSEDKEKYFIGAKPDFLYVDESTDTLISVTLTDYKIDDSKIDDRIIEYCNIYKRSVPNFANYKIAKNKTKSGKIIAAFYYTSTSPNRDLYNFFILTSLEGKEVVITINCSLENVLNFSSKFMDILNSIDVLEE